MKMAEIYSYFRNSSVLDNTENGKMGINYAKVNGFQNIGIGMT